MSAEEARAVANAEGLLLVGSVNSSGFEGVRMRKRPGCRTVFSTFLNFEPGEEYLGAFRTAEETALAVAREERQRLLEGALV